MNPWLVSGLLILLLVYSGWRGFRNGLGIALVNFGGFLLASGAASTFYTSLAALFNRLLGSPRSLTNLACFTVIWLTVELIYRLTLSFVKAHRLFLPESAASLPNRIGGMVMGVAQSALIVTFGLVALLALPLPVGLKNALTQAQLAKQMISAGGRYQQQINSLVADLSDTLNFLTVKPKSEESISLGFSTTNVTIDDATEQQMLKLVNKERTSRGLEALVIDPQITAVARLHSRDMFARGYFSHVTPEGVDPFERMKAGGVKFIAAGENLALAPTLSLAHSGLMNSPGHRANILEPSFHRVGIGVIDGGVYGKMFTQDFAD